ncbi:MAG: hypothetical protein LAO51_00025 [Acidobacteriia bacterium]|nr:hypothetical protein [Terriglobia bacterium]
MKRWVVLLSVLTVAFMGAGVAMACPTIEGYVRCDTNQDGLYEDSDTPLANVVVRVVNLAGTWSGSVVTRADGYYIIQAQCTEDTYRQTLDPVTLPSDYQYLIPTSGEFVIDLPGSGALVERNWLIGSANCQLGKCWLTGGGAKYEPIVGLKLATQGKQYSFGGNVFPGCSPTAGDGGQWNTIDHVGNLHFQGWSVQIVACGNVPGIPEGSTSPATPFNYIEFQGTGTLKGISGNKIGTIPVYFFARCEDRNEPGSNGAKDGALIDRYFLHVFTDPLNPVSSTLLLIDQDGNPATVDPVRITDGNLQLHISSCP